MGVLMDADTVDTHDGREPVYWCTYRGDHRAILDPAHNPLILMQPVPTPFGTVRFPNAALGLLGTRRGPRYPWNVEALYPVRATYDREADTTRVGWSFVQPEQHRVAL